MVDIEVREESRRLSVLILVGLIIMSCSLRLLQRQVVYVKPSQMVRFGNSRPEPRRTKTENEKENEKEKMQACKRAKHALLIYFNYV